MAASAPTIAPDKNAAELDRLAELFMAHAPATIPPERLAIACYKKATAFLAVRDKIRSGEINVEPTKEAKGVQLSTCSAPNLKKSHPLNLVSQRFGNLDRVNRIKLWLDKNPTPERDPSDLVPRLQREFPDLEWGVAEINVAREVFPHYCPAAASKN